ncbi:tRNA adenosine deaminase-associated protein [Actinoalloteichus hymeniacidonis]|uniref:tRNA adenosine deaminase-associated protein n=1 Tax=Actinoalloteichus hymeniacidonis TaxID=340345 RepID=A0AAC9HLJ8_9PSEU|nr:tRNA adenosine deaminase-associated protein [Actinoalloteichus hymeniacidonis]AOS61011.1 putative tRNA adenosine deaminase-associated protein [Actinoalloteichus hymeniacidonis]MBB5910989.1 putative tRNA adenosine deaminase-associated protein [Actinoalloteichus hymeniacidonis]
MSVQEPIQGTAVAVLREEGRWRCLPLPDACLLDLDRAVTELRNTRSTGAAFALLNVDDEFFILLRPTPGGMALLLSDAVASLYYDVAEDVVDALGVEPPEEDDEEIWPVGDLAILADLGLSDAELTVIAEEDVYPDEQLMMIAQRCGFGTELNAVLER